MELGRRDTSTNWRTGGSGGIRTWISAGGYSSTISRRGGRRGLRGRGRKELEGEERTSQKKSSKPNTGGWLKTIQKSVKMEVWGLLGQLLEAFGPQDGPKLRNPPKSDFEDPPSDPVWEPKSEKKCDLCDF